MTPEATRLVEEFDFAARSYGWESDQGYGAEVRRAKNDYEHAKDSLVAYIEMLEQRSKKK